MSVSVTPTDIAYGNPAFFEKNKADVDYGSIVVITATDGVGDPGQAIVDFMRDRRNDTGWATSGSSDAGATTLVVDLGDSYSHDTLAFVAVNWKSYTIQYWNGSSYVDFSTPIAPTNNALTEPFHQFTPVAFQKYKIIINSTMVANDDKLCAQMIATLMMGQFTSVKPLIDTSAIGKNRRVLKMVDGRNDVRRGVGAATFHISQDGVKDQGDITLYRNLFDSRRGFLVWLCGGVAGQFPVQIDGYRRKDWYLMNCTNELPSNWLSGFYAQGIQIDMTLTEVV